MNTDTWWATATGVAVSLIATALAGIAVLAAANLITALGRTWA